MGRCAEFRITTTIAHKPERDGPPAAGPLHATHGLANKNKAALSVKIRLIALPLAPGTVPALLAVLSVLPALALAFDGTRLLQVLVLTLSAWIWIVWPQRSARLRALQALLAGTLASAFLLDATVRGFILRTYGALPDSTMVTSALANTGRFEASEFVYAYWPGMLRWALLLLLSASMLWVLLRQWLQASARVTTATQLKWQGAAFLVALLVLLMALSIKPWRKYHPLVFWPAWAQQLADKQAGWHNAHRERGALKQRAAGQAPMLDARSPDTLVLVISDSIDRKHLSLYGYARPTTPRLDARLQQDAKAFKVFRHSWSADASTVAALENFFHFGEPASPSRNHLLALAAAAGYQTWWISNHDDLAIHLQHAQLAERQQMLNHIPGRSAASLDRTVLPALEQALTDGPARKLIVVHLLGAHPHYRLRHPPDQAPFRGLQDSVYRQLERNGRSARTRELLNDYDSALHFHDSVVDQTLELTRRLGRNAGWIFLSDHGQEVGSVSDHAGHSASSPDGYRIPLLAWGELMRELPDELGQVPIRADWLAHTVTRLLGLRWKGYRPERDFLDPGYRWQPPPHPVPIDYLS